MTNGKLSKNDTPVVAILTGSPSDLPVVLKGREVLDSLEVPCDVRVLSAHRTPQETAATCSVIGFSIASPALTSFSPASQSATQPAELAAPA